MEGSGERTSEKSENVQLKKKQFQVKGHVKGQMKGQGEKLKVSSEC